MRDRILQPVLALPALLWFGRPAPGAPPSNPSFRAGGPSPPREKPPAYNFCRGRDKNCWRTPGGGGSRGRGAPVGDGGGARRIDPTGFDPPWAPAYNSCRGRDKNCWCRWLVGRPWGRVALADRGGSTRWPEARSNRFRDAVARRAAWVWKREWTGWRGGRKAGCSDPSSSCRRCGIRADWSPGRCPPEAGLPWGLIDRACGAVIGPLMGSEAATVGPGPPTARP